VHEAGRQASPCNETSKDAGETAAAARYCCWLAGGMRLQLPLSTLMTHGIRFSGVGAPHRQRRR